MSDIDVAATVRARAEEAGIDPGTIVLIINAVIAIIKLWRERRKTTGDTVAALDPELLNAIIDAIIAILEAFRSK